MPTFEIPDGPTTIDVSRSAGATAVYSVTNKSPDSADGRLSVVLSGGSKTEWFSVDGNRERTFASGESQTVSVTVRVPADVPAGEYPFRLRVIAVNDPDNDHAEGPMTVAKLGPPAPIGKRMPIWPWILIGLVVVIAIAAALYFIMRSNPSPGPVKTATPTVDTSPATPVPAPKPAVAAAPADRLSTGQTLKGETSDAIVSKNGFFRAVMQTDCNFVVYNAPRALWASGTQGRGSGCFVAMQGDGNLVVYTQGGVPVWASGTNGNANAEVVMQDDGNLVVYAGGRALWASNTVVR
jgi:hypothetical protein